MPCGNFYSLLTSFSVKLIQAENLRDAAHALRASGLAERSGGGAVAQNNSSLQRPALLGGIQHARAERISGAYRTFDIPRRKLQAVDLNVVVVFIKPAA